jgi:exosome complex component RRP4
MSVANTNRKAEIVFPGDVIFEGKNMLPGRGTFRDGDKIVSKVIGLKDIKRRVVSVIPLAGPYIPKVGDYVIGEIIEVGLNHWMVDINSPYQAAMAMFELQEFVEKNTDLSKYFDFGDLIFTKIINVTKNKYINLTMKDPRCKKLIGGLVVHITPSKVPRLIGKKGSMVNTIKTYTGSVILVGQNGRVWVKGGNETLAAEAIYMVDKYSHQAGLTEMVEKFLKENSTGGENGKKE